MTTPRPCVAEAVRRFSHDVSLQTRQRAVLARIRDCRTSELGGHVWRCDSCQHERVAYNSCRDRHCPGCQATQSLGWLEDRLDEVLPVPHFHVVFTLPGELRSIALGNQRAIYDLLFAASSKTLATIGRDPKHLGAKLGFFGILHTWGQSLAYHPHVHYVVPGGGISLDDSHWIPSRPRFLVPQRVLAVLFRNRFLAGLRQLVATGDVDLPIDLRAPGRFDQLLRALGRKKWVVDLREPFSSPDRVLKYLARYTHRVAIANGRILSVDDDGVRFNARDYRTGKLNVARLSGAEFVRRFALHVLPKRFVRLRYYGFLAHRNRKNNIDRCRTLIAAGGHAFETSLPPPTAPARREADPSADAAEAVRDSPSCPRCCGRMTSVAEIERPFRPSAELHRVRAPPSRVLRGARR